MSLPDIEQVAIDFARSLPRKTARTALTEALRFLRVCSGANEANGFIVANNANMNDGDFRDANKSMKTTVFYAALALRYRDDHHIICAFLALALGASALEFAEQVGDFDYETERAIVRTAQARLRRALRATAPSKQTIASRCVV